MLKFQQWFATFTSCVDETLLSSQYTKLRLEGCLEGEAVERIRGFRYSEVAYNAAKEKLVRKYAGD